MPQIEINFDEAVEFTPVPDGTYSARIVDSTLKTSKAGNSYIEWKMTLFGAEGELEQYNNKMVFHRTMTSGKGSGILKALGKAVGVDLANGSLDTEAFLTKELTVVLKREVDPNTQQLSDFPSVKATKALVQ